MPIYVPDVASSSSNFRSVNNRFWDESFTKVFGLVIPIDMEIILFVVSHQYRVGSIWSSFTISTCRQLVQHLQGCHLQSMTTLRNVLSLTVFSFVSKRRLKIALSLRRSFCLPSDLQKLVQRRKFFVSGFNLYAFQAKGNSGEGGLLTFQKDSQIGGPVFVGTPRFFLMSCLLPKRYSIYCYH